MNVLKKINKMRIDRNWSVYRLSVESGIPQSTLTNMFNRETLPSITTLEWICNAFGITMSEFFREDESDAQSVELSEAVSEFEKLSEADKRFVLKMMCRLNEPK